MIDILVAGAGPVGLGLAIRARLAGLTVTVIEPRADPVDKVCGEGLMPAAMAALAELGVRPAGHPFVGIRYLDRHYSAEARFDAGPGLGVRRTVLQGTLAARADEVGVVRLAGRISGIAQHSDRVEACGLAARWVVAADGLHSSVRQGLGLARPVRGRTRFGHRRHYQLAPWTDFVEVYWSARAEAYVTPVAADTVGVAVLCDRGVRFDEVLSQLPALQDRLAGAPGSAVRAAGPLRQNASSRVAGRVLLAGDAAGYVDALTGEGIAAGLATAEAALRCIEAGQPEAYDAAWNAATRRYRLLTAALVAASGLPRVRRQVVPAAARWPGLFRRGVNYLAA